MRRALFAGLILVAAAALSFVAVAFACTPQANIGLDKPSAAGVAPVYAAGESAIVLGYDFDPNSPANVVVRLDGAQIASAPVDADGRVRAAFVIPSSIQPGPHTVSADGIDERGQAFRPAASFAVARPVAVATPPAAPAAGTADAAAGPTAVPAPGRPAVATTVAAPRPAPTRAGRDQRSDRPAPARRATEPAATPQAAAGDRVFETSVGAASRPSRTAGSPAKHSASRRHPTTGAGESSPNAARSSSDRISGFALSAARAAAPSQDRSLAIGAALLAGGLVLLFGGLLAVEARARRVPARVDRDR